MKGQREYSIHGQYRDGNHFDNGGFGLRSDAIKAARRESRTAVDKFVEVRNVLTDKTIAEVRNGKVMWLGYPVVDRSRTMSIEESAELLAREKDSWTVRSPHWPDGEITTWSREQANREARLASQLSPTYSASIQNTMTGSIEALYVAGRNTYEARQEMHREARMNPPNIEPLLTRTRYVNAGDLARVRREFAEKTPVKTHER